MHYTSKTLFCVCVFCLLIHLFNYPCLASDDTSPKQVVFVHYNLKDDKTESAIVKSFKKMMTKRGYVEGRDVDYIDYVTSKPERISAGDVVDMTEKYIETADMFITSSWTSLYVRSKLAKSKVPQLFTPALKSTALNMLASVESEPGTNLSGVYLMYPPEKILRLTRHILPEAGKYAFVYDSRIPADIIFKADYNQLNEKERYGITVYYLDLATGIETVLQKMNKMKIEVFGGAVGVFKNLEVLSQSKLPIITSLLFDRSRKSLKKNIGESNIIAGLYNPFDYCGKVAAEMAADIFDGKTTIEKMVPRPAQQLAIVNMISARRLGISVPFSVLEAVDIVIK